MVCLKVSYRRASAELAGWRNGRRPSTRRGVGSRDSTGVRSGRYIIRSSRECEQTSLLVRGKQTAEDTREIVSPGETT